MSPAGGLSKRLAADDLKKISCLDLEKTPLVKTGAQLVTALPVLDELSGGIALYLGFSDQTKFAIRPEPTQFDDDKDNAEESSEIADWEMYTPSADT